MEAHVTAQSQTFRLRERATEAKIQHGQDVRADLPHVRVGANGRTVDTQGQTVERGEVFFCHMGRILVREVLSAGDDAPLPDSAVTEGLEVLEPGYYDLLNVLVRSNGDIRVVVDTQSRVQAAAWPAETAWP